MLLIFHCELKVVLRLTPFDKKKREKLCFLTLKKLATGRGSARTTPARTPSHAHYCADFSKLSAALHGLSVGHSCLSVLSNFYGELPTVKILE